MGLTVALLVREGADDTSLRYRAAALAAGADEFHILALRLPQPSTSVSDAPRPPGAWRVTGKLRGLYATHIHYPPSYYDIEGPIDAARRRFLPVAPPLAAYPRFAIVEASKVNAVEVAREVKARSVDVLAPMTGVIRPLLLEAPRLGCLNAHHGWLPEIRGMWSTVWAIAEGRPDWVGMSVHWMDAGLDTGPILARARPAFSIHDGHDTLYVRLDLLAAELISDVLAALKRGARVTIPNASDRGEYRSRPTFGTHLRFARRQRSFFLRYGQRNVLPLESSPVSWSK